MSAAVLAPLVVPNSRLDHAALNGPVHLRAIYRAIRHGGCDHLVMLPGAPGFRMPERAHHRPVIILVGDDTSEATGPTGFHQKSLCRVVRTSQRVFVMTGTPDPPAYDAAARSAAVSGSNVLIVETCEAREGAWVELIQSARSSRRKFTVHRRPGCAG